MILLSITGLSKQVRSGSVPATLHPDRSPEAPWRNPYRISCYERPSGSVYHPVCRATARDPSKHQSGMAGAGSHPWTSRWQWVAVWIHQAGPACRWRNRRMPAAGHV